MAFETHTGALVRAADGNSQNVTHPRLYRRLFKRPLEMALVLLASPVVVPRCHDPGADGLGS